MENPRLKTLRKSQSKSCQNHFGSIKTERVALCLTNTGGCITNIENINKEVELGEIWLDRTRQNWVTQCRFDRLCACFMGSIEISISFDPQVFNHESHQVSFSRDFPGCSTEPSGSNNFREPPKPKASSAWRFNSSTVEVEEMERVQQRPLGRQMLISSRQIWDDPTGCTWAIPLLTKFPFSCLPFITGQFTSVY